MPRDAKGKLFGINSTIKNPQGEHKKVGGFVVVNVPLSRDQMQELGKTVSAKHVYYWHEVEAIDFESDPHAPYAKPYSDNVIHWPESLRSKSSQDEYVEHTDLCPVDIAQRDGLKLPFELGDTAVRNTLIAYAANLAHITDPQKAAAMTCKVVWCD